MATPSKWNSFISTYLLKLKPHTKYWANTVFVFVYFLFTQMEDWYFTMCYDFGLTVSLDLELLKSDLLITPVTGLQVVWL